MTAAVNAAWLGVMASSTDDPSPRPLDLRKVRPSAGSHLPGYGLTPGAALERARVVKAVTDAPQIRQRPTVVVTVAAIVALGAFAWWAVLLYGVLTEDAPADALFWVALATGMVALFGAAWAWELYDLRKGFVVFVTLLLTVLVLVFVIIIAVAAVRGDDIDFDVGKLLGLSGGDGNQPGLADLRGDHGGGAASAPGATGLLPTASELRMGDLGAQGVQVATGKLEDWVAGEGVLASGRDAAAVPHPDEEVRRSSEDAPRADPALTQDSADHPEGRTQPWGWPPGSTT